MLGGKYEKSPILKTYPFMWSWTCMLAPVPAGLCTAIIDKEIISGDTYISTSPLKPTSTSFTLPTHLHISKSQQRGHEGVIEGCSDEPVSYTATAAL